MEYSKRGFLSTLSSACLNLGIDRDDVLITHGGASILSGLATSTDKIDVSISMWHWQLLLSAGHPLISVNVVNAHNVRWHLRKGAMPKCFRHRKFYVVKQS